MKRKTPEKAVPFCHSDKHADAEVIILSNEERGYIRVEHGNGDLDTVTGLTRDAAVSLIAALREAFDIPDREAELADLLASQSDTTMEVMDKVALASIANIMYENGLRTASITPQNVMAGFVPPLAIDVSVPGVVIYTLQGEPLNVKYRTE